MTYKIEARRQIGGVKIAIISKVDVHPAHCAQSIGFIGLKQPVFVVVQQGEQLMGYSMSGKRVPVEKITAICPQTLQDF